ncbi:MAG TPA: hypothetical protein VK891_03675, partial [Euzebyales bacterium]|nr:hypothetical protein [Euzebyales bacterium]
MPYLVAAVVLVGTLCAVDLLLTMAVVRRLRELTRQLGGLAGGAGVELLAVGAPLPAFTAESVDGQAVDSGTAAPAFVGFLSTTCRSCAEQLPELVEFLRRSQGEAPARVPGDADVLRAGDARRGAAVVVVAGPHGPEGEQFVDELRRIS